METITLSAVERLSLANQYRILAALTNARQSAEYTRNAEILLGGHTALYHNIFNQLTEEVPARVTAELQDLLDMFFGIRSVFHEHPQSEIDAAGIDRQQLSFTGFDLEYEQYADQARVMVEHMGLYEELKGAQFDSHTPGDMQRYRRMLPIYQAAFKSNEGLTVAMLKAMQAAIA